jgi:sterol 3beta-glucosyltransferase
MKIAIVALGSRGDVQPYVALGKALKAAGHGVKLVTHENFETLVTSHGLTFCAMPGNVQEVVESPEIRALLEKGNFLAINAHTSKLVKTISIEWAKAGLVACQGMDLLIGGVGGGSIMRALAEKLQIPILQAHVFPYQPTTAFPAVLFPAWLSKFGGIVNWLSHHLMRQIMWQSSRNADRLVRSQVLNLPPAPFFGPKPDAKLTPFPTLYGFSPSVIAKPADWENTEVTGAWFLDAEPDWKPPEALVSFLAEGPAPLYIGFGSMGSRNPQETADLVLQAIAKTGQRAILQSGWGGLATDHLPKNVLIVNSIPHSWLFPQMAAIVHHGGAGTTAAALRAGVPSIVVPFFGDQPFWGQRVADLGVGPAPIPRKQLTVDRLVQAIQTAMGDPVMRQRSAQLGTKIQAEDGLALVVETIGSFKLG